MRRRMAEGHLQEAPILDDVRVIREYCEMNNVRADGVTGGFPCQGTSSAGQRQGLEDPRTALATHMFHCFDSVKAPGAWSRVTCASVSVTDCVELLVLVLQVVHDHRERLRDIVKVNEQCHELSPCSRLCASRNLAMVRSSECAWQPAITKEASKRNLQVRWVSANGFGVGSPALFPRKSAVIQSMSAGASCFKWLCWQS